MRVKTINSYIYKEGVRGVQRAKGFVLILLILMLFQRNINLYILSKLTFKLMWFSTESIVL